MAYAKSYQYIRSESVKMFFEFSYNFPIYFFCVYFKRNNRLQEHNRF